MKYDELQKCCNQEEGVDLFTKKARGPVFTHLRPTCPRKHLSGAVGGPRMKAPGTDPSSGRPVDSSLSGATRLTGGGPPRENPTRPLGDSAPRLFPFMPDVTSSRQMDARGVMGMVACCVLWGGNAVAVKFATPDLPPLGCAAIRFVIGLPVVARSAEGWATRPGSGGRSGGCSACMRC